MRKIILFILMFSSFQAFSGGGWTQKKGEGFFLLSQRIISGPRYFNSDGKIIKSPLLSAFTTNIYGEYGFSDQLTGIVYSPFLTSLSRRAGVDHSGVIFSQDNAFGLGDIDLALKYKLWDKKIKVSATLTMGLATGNYNAGSTSTLHLGDGEHNQMVTLNASKSLKKGSFATLFVGYNNRNSEFSDEVHLGGEIGLKKNKLTAILKIYVKKSMFNETRKDSPIPGIYSDNAEYLSFTPQILYNLKNNVGLMLEGGFALASRNIIAAPSINFGVYLDLKK